MGIYTKVADPAGDKWVEVGADGGGALTPAEIVSAPVKVSGDSDPIEWTVKQTDGTQKKVTVLPGGTSGAQKNTFEVTLSPGVLPGLMVGAGGTGGRSSQSQYPAGGGGAGGVIGTGANVPVILPVQETATYTVTVGSTTIAPNTIQGEPTTLAVQGQTPFASAVGGGRGLAIYTAYQVGARSGGSGGGGAGGTSPYIDIGEGVPGQGNRGGSVEDYSNTPTGGGGGYGSEGGSNGDGGAGFDLATALNLDANDGITGSFLAQVSVDGFIAGGGSGGGTATAGGGAPQGDGKNFTGSGGGGDTGTANPGGNGGAGAVYIITDPPA